MEGGRRKCRREEMQVDNGRIEKEGKRKTERKREEVKAEKK